MGNEKSREDMLRAIVQKLQKHDVDVSIANEIVQYMDDLDKLNSKLTMDESSACFCTLAFAIKRAIVTGASVDDLREMTSKVIARVWRDHFAS